MKSVKYFCKRFTELLRYPLYFGCVVVQVTFRYQTRLCDEDRTIIDDNRKDEKPMELIFGKKFKLEVWETCLKSMRVDEVASYIVDVSVCRHLVLMLLLRLVFVFNRTGVGLDVLKANV